MILNLRRRWRWRGGNSPKLSLGSCLACSVTRKKSPNVYKKLPKNDFTRKMIDFNTLQKLPKNVGYLGKFIVAKGFKKLPKVQKIARSGHTGLNVH